MFSGCSQDCPRIFSGCSDGSCKRGGSEGSDRSIGSISSGGSCGSSGFGRSFEADWLGGSGLPGESCGYFFPI